MTPAELALTWGLGVGSASGSSRWCLPRSSRRAGSRSAAACLRCAHRFGRGGTADLYAAARVDRADLRLALGRFRVRGIAVLLAHSGCAAYARPPRIDRHPPLRGGCRGHRFGRGGRTRAARDEPASQHVRRARTRLAFARLLARRGHVLHLRRDDQRLHRHALHRDLRRRRDPAGARGRPRRRHRRFQHDRLDRRGLALGPLRQPLPALRVLRLARALALPLAARAQRSQHRRSSCRRSWCSTASTGSPPARRTCAR